jgi:hypothetical protein
MTSVSTSSYSLILEPRGAILKKKATLVRNFRNCAILCFLILLSE